MIEGSGSQMLAPVCNPSLFTLTGDVDMLPWLLRNRGLWRSHKLVRMIPGKPMNTSFFCLIWCISPLTGASGTGINNHCQGQLPPHLEMVSLFLLAPWFRNPLLTLLPDTHPEAQDSSKLIAPPSPFLKSLFFISSVNTQI